MLTAVIGYRFAEYLTEVIACVINVLVEEMHQAKHEYKTIMKKFFRMNYAYWKMLQYLLKKFM